jgi:ABC-2 type transport system ATP-binding protein
LVRTLAGRVRLDAGRVVLFGDDVAAGKHPARRRLGIVPQEIALYPPLSARENLRAFGAFHGMERARLDRRVAWALDWTGLAERADEPVRRFSGGMKRRLNIACGILHEPELVLLDEPTVGVDPQSRQRIHEMLQELHRAGTSILLTTHQLDEAERLCQRIVILDYGRVVAAGTLDELVARTVGRGRLVSLTLAAPPERAIAANGVEVDGCRVRAHVEDVAGELPSLLRAVDAAGGRVDDLRVDPPTLHAVFLHLTGRELRE